MGGTARVLREERRRGGEEEEEEGNGGVGEGEEDKRAENAMGLIQRWICGEIRV